MMSTIGQLSRVQWLLFSHMPIQTDKHQAQLTMLSTSSLASEEVFSDPQLVKLHSLCATSMQVIPRLSLPGTLKSML